ncbi:hypothetical protein [Novacetimonas cocois]|uniref:SMODS and SLOG-associating 2TM effector domain-containing protein n=1 Tax=Novacetimonas cocois TaxID=1747507 RepID=A0A365YQD6_9PROT|nr:hypothetical protein [Novacetimonas cocois]RBM04962.1 hypothetical protein NJLHNGOC_14390 [Novacetimonas cocois]
MPASASSEKKLPLYGIPITVGVTGHRNLSDPDKVREILIGQMEAIRYRFPNSPLRALSALAAGADCLFADVALSLGWELHAVLPLEIDDYLHDFTEPDKAIFKDLLDKAQTCQVIPTVIPGSEAQVEYPLKEGPDRIYRDLQYASVGIHIAQRSHIMVAMWNGKQPNGLGGTAQIVNFRENGFLEPMVGETMPEGFCVDMLPTVVPQNPLYPPDIGLVCKIFCARTNDPTLGEGRKPFEVEWTEGQRKCLSLDEIAIGVSSEGILADLDRIATWNGVVQDDLVKRGVPPAPKDYPQYQTRLCVTREVLDRNITEKTSKVRKNFGWLFIAMGLTVILTNRAAGDPAMWVKFSLVGSLVSFFLILAFVKFSNWKTLREDTIYLRVLVEGMRIQDYWNLLGIRDGIFLQYPPTHHHHDMMSFVRRALQGGSLSSYTDDDYADKLEYVRREWLQGQITYYDQYKITPDRKKQKLINRSAIGLFGLSVISLVIITLHVTFGFLDITTQPWAGTLLSALEHMARLGMAMAIILLSYLEFSGLTDDLADYEMILALFKRADKRLKHPFGKMTNLPPQIVQGQQRAVLRSLGCEILRADNMRWAERALRKKIKLIRGI